LEGQYALPEFDYLKDCWWIVTEKVDGTNIRVMWDGNTVTFGGKTDDTQIPAHLANHLLGRFTERIMQSVFGDEGRVCLYGEGYGAKIQKSGGRYRGDAGFIMFDANIGGTWLRRDDVADISEKLLTSVVPVIGIMTLPEIYEYVKSGCGHSCIAEDKTLMMEGVVARPVVELFARDGSRIITKLKTKDFLRSRDI
jgi:hypothetical protein